jgi:adenylosuccinate synthase
MKALEVVCGAQYGSEAKGHVTARLMDHRYLLESRLNELELVNVRVAGPNAGHTAYTADGVPVALRQIPVGVTRPYRSTLVIAPGSEIDMEVLMHELDMTHEMGLWGVGTTLYIDPNATLIEPWHKEQENNPDGRLADLVTRTGSTGKGIGAARAARLMRSARRLVDNRDYVEMLRSFSFVHVEPYRYGLFDHVIIEGTQGYGLGLHGLHYPQCTSSDCRAIDFIAMAGISPWETIARNTFSVWAVARMFPIRVAGNSGPMFGETTWEALGLPEERTTVTKKVRRVGAWDADLVRDAVWANGGGPWVKLALTMTDQMWPEVKNSNSYAEAFGAVRDRPASTGGNLFEFMTDVQVKTGAMVGMITTGPNAGFVV